MKQQLKLILKGVCMGTADVIPGVSGGTMALILGIYARLVGSIRRIDAGIVRLVVSPRAWRRLFELLRRPDAADERDADDQRIAAVAFLLTLGSGIVLAVLTGVKVVPHLMERYPAPTAGFFFGLILASMVVPYRMMERRGAAQALAFAAMAAGTYVLVGLPTTESRFATGTIVLSSATPPAEARRISAQSAIFATRPTVTRDDLTFRPRHDVEWPAGAREVTVPVIATRAGAEANLAAGSIRAVVSGVEGPVELRQPEPLEGGVDPPLWYLFICGAIAISAMILPGISGSFLLLLLGQYGYVLHQVHQLVYSREASAAAAVGIFLGGLLVGILAFSRLLHWLLEHAQSVTMAALVGLMLGSLRKIWPFQEVHGASYENVLPARLDTTVLATLACFAIGVVIVISMTIAGARKRTVLSS